MLRGSRRMADARHPLAQHVGGHEQPPTQHGEARRAFVEGERFSHPTSREQREDHRWPPPTSSSASRWVPERLPLPRRTPAEPPSGTPTGHSDADDPGWPTFPDTIATLTVTLRTADEGYECTPTQ